MKSLLSSVIVLSAASGLVLLVEPVASANVFVWDQPAFGVYEFGSSWEGGSSPGAGDIAQFGASIGTTVADVTVLFNVSNEALGAQVVSGHYDWRFGNPDLSYMLTDSILVGVGNPDGILPNSASLTLGPSIPSGIQGQISTRFLQVGWQFGGRDGHLDVDGTTINVQSGAGFINGTADFRNGAQLSTGASDRVSDIGAFGDQAEVTLRDKSTRWDHSNTQFWIGHGPFGGHGMLNVLHGAALEISNNALLVGNSDTGGIGDVLIQGQGSRVSGQAIVLGGAASLTIQAGGRAETSGPLFVNGGSPLSGTTSIVNLSGSDAHLTARDLHLSGGFSGFGAAGGTGIVNILGGQVEITNDAFLYPDGAITVTVGAMTIGSVTPNLGAVTVGPNGRLIGSSTINGDLINEGGFIAPGFSAGALTINGDLSLHDGILGIEIGSMMDLLDVSGAVTLGGVLQVSDLGDATILPGDTFTFLTASSISGSFDQLVDLTPYGLMLDFDGGVGRLVATVPAPGPGVVLTMGLAFATRRRRA